MYLDQDTTDDFLDAPELVYAPLGRTWEERLAAQGYDLQDLGALAGHLEQRGTRAVPELPPLTER